MVAAASATNVMKPSRLYFLEFSSNLKTGRCFAFALRVVKMDASVVLEGDEFLTWTAFDIRAASVSVAIACPRNVKV